MANEKSTGKAKDGAPGQRRVHAVRNKVTGQNVDPMPTQADWKDQSLYPRDQFERVDESGEVIAEPASADGDDGNVVWGT